MRNRVGLAPDFKMITSDYTQANIFIKNSPNKWFVSMKRWENQIQILGATFYTIFDID